MIKTQILPTPFFGIKEFIDNFNTTNASPETSMVPSAFCYEVEGGFSLEVELPGVKKDDLDVQIEKNILIVKGMRTRQKETLHYERRFKLASDIDTENIKVSFENGILYFELHKKMQSSARKLNIV